MSENSEQYIKEQEKENLRLEKKYPKNNLNSWLDIREILPKIQKMDLAQWYRQLTLMSMAHNEFSNRRFDRTFTILEGLDEAIDNILVQDDNESSGALNTTAVDYLRVNDATSKLSWFFEHHTEKDSDHIKRYVHAFGDHCKNMFDKNDYLFFEEFAFSEEPCVKKMEGSPLANAFDDDFPEIYAKISLAHPDQVIINDFKELLSNAREKYHQPKPKKNIITKHHLADWHKDMILPFLYIWAWKSATKSDISYFKIGSILFPDNTDIDPAEKIRKTVKPKAMEMISSSFIRQVEAQLNIQQGFKAE